MKCADCRHTFLISEFTRELLLDLYSNYYPRSEFKLESYLPHKESNGFTTWLNGVKSSTFRWVPRNVCILDIGCGFGESLGFHHARGCEVYGVEADENIRRVSEKFGYNVHIGLFDDSLYEADFFDYVTMDQVIEHVTNPISTLRGIARILKPGGTIILSTPNAQGWGARFFGRYWINWHAPYHIQFFSHRSIRLAAEQAGLVVEEVKTITNSDWLLYQWLHLLSYPKMGRASSFWSKKKKSVTFLYKVTVKLISVIHKTKINHLVTRIFDNMRVGDNFVFILKKPE